jgi:hypothetical protein
MPDIVIFVRGCVCVTFHMLENNFLAFAPRLLLQKCFILQFPSFRLHLNFVI